jgi:integrase
MGSAQKITNSKGEETGYWEAHFRIDGKGIERRKDEKTGRRFASEHAAEKYANRQEFLAEQGEYLVNDTITIGDFMRKVLDDVRDGLRPHTVGKYTEFITNLERHPEFAGRRLKRHLNGGNVQVVATWLMRPKEQGGRGMAKGTAGKHLEWLRRVAKAAVIEKLITYPTLLEIQAVKVGRVGRPRKIPLTNVQVRRLAAAMPDYFRAAVLVQAGLGLRVGELRGLREQDITWPMGVVGGRPARAGSVHVDTQVHRDGERRETKSVGRDVPLPPRMAKVLREHTDAFEPLEMPNGERLIFYQADRAGGAYQGVAPMNTSYERMMPGIAERVGADDPDWPSKRTGKRVASHALRDHFICACGARGVPVGTIAAWTGDTEETILNKYLRAMPGFEQRAVDAVEDLWAEGDAELSEDDEPGQDVGNL